MDSSICASEDPASSEDGVGVDRVDGTRVQVNIGEIALTGHLWDNATAEDLISLLPLTLTLADFNGSEKVARLPQKLSTEGVPPGDEPAVDDIAYWAPDGNLFFPYGDIGYWDGIVRIGRLDSGVAAIVDLPDGFTATIELADCPPADAGDEP